MLSLANVRDWLKSIGPAEHYYIGKLENKKEKSIGLYQRKENGPPVTAIGGLDCTKYDIKRISVLIHWNKNARETEEISSALFEKLRKLGSIEISGMHIDYLMLQVPEPQDVGTDDNGIYERVIWFDLYYERRME